MRGLLPLAVAISSATARPSSLLSVPRDLLADGCPTPGLFNVTDFHAFLPSSNGTDNGTRIDFVFADPVTKATTSCHRNSSSVPVYPVPGLTARYPCENRLVEFLWTQNWSTGSWVLTLTQAWCPAEGVTDPQQNPGNEVAGSVRPNLSCTETYSNSTDGPGKECTSDPAVLSGQYSSISPRPHASTNSAQRGRLLLRREEAP